MHFYKQKRNITVSTLFLPTDSYKSNRCFLSWYVKGLGVKPSSTVLYTTTNQPPFGNNNIIINPTVVPVPNPHLPKLPSVRVIIAVFHPANHLESKDIRDQPSKSTAVVLKVIPLPTLYTVHTVYLWQFILLFAIFPIKNGCSFISHSVCD